MAYSKMYNGAEAVIERPAGNPAFSGEINNPFSQTGAPDLNSRELHTRLGVIRELYMAETSPAGKKQFRNEAHSIKLLISVHRRKMFISAGSLLLAVIFLIVFLQNIGLAE
ncbi:MAG: hypothetical protein ACNA8K_01190 [Cyclonatronaceae bacterium]